MVMQFGRHAGIFVYQGVIILGAAVLYRWMVGDDVEPWPRMTTLGVGWKAAVVIAVTIVVLGLVGNIGMGLLVEYVPGMQEDAAAYSERIRNLLLEAEGGYWWMGMTSVCVTAPVAEEALFRGTILQEQRKSKMGVWGLAWLNGGLFAIFHANLLVIPSLVLLGAFLAYITLVSESLLLPILAHALVNTFNGVLLPQLLSTGGTGPLKGEAAAPEVLWAWLAALGCAAAVGWWLVDRWER
jgi:membrane protease YdiL (CAAX protease family)